ncbi:N-acetylglucosamine-6-phosphate deacetylase [Mycobacterium sp. 1274756.6]|uniref:N-acetylglucosamine-6-phosphate deacetylase n=1 Tax=Mycobacterium sp. 1274756.6 TaxID=1834076 RepID=UPI000801AEED|nr:N-acetylglucosamine-6-phosphate deacetylase [Mycobacterium sp. 1274756.6]OBJ67372.1 N-acetylglucosamine-6-phosphate deacetylase [Mycobacterium sp. 1274756.6]
MITAGAVVFDGRVHRPGWLQITDGVIAGGGAGAPPRPAHTALPDAIVVPGFVDMHCHGGGGASYPAATASAAEQASAFHRRHGTTTTLASLVSAAPGPLLEAVGVLAAATRAGHVAGIHLEGPWLSAARCGAHDRRQLRNPDPVEIDTLLAAADGTIRMVTLAPELPGALEAVERLAGAGVVVAVGHTDADYAQTRAAIDAGATVATHLFNAMRPLHHRDPGPVAALLEDERVCVELIADGVHLHPAVLRAVIAAAGPDRVALVTDAMAAAGCGDGRYRLGRHEVDVTAGVARVAGSDTIAGSTVTMDAVFRAVIGDAPDDPIDDAALLAAVQMTAATPARALGLETVGALRPGVPANLVVLDRNLAVSGVMVDGGWQDRDGAVC